MPINDSRGIVFDTEKNKIVTSIQNNVENYDNPYNNYYQGILSTTLDGDIIIFPKYSNKIMLADLKKMALYSIKDINQYGKERDRLFYSAVNSNEDNIYAYNNIDSIWEIYDKKMNLLETHRIYFNENVMKVLHSYPDISCDGKGVILKEGGIFELGIFLNNILK